MLVLIIVGLVWLTLSIFLLILFAINEGFNYGYPEAMSLIIFAPLTISMWLYKAFRYTISRNNKWLN